MDLLTLTARPLTTPLVDRYCSPCSPLLCCSSYKHHTLIAQTSHYLSINLHALHQTPTSLHVSLPDSSLPQYLTSAPDHSNQRLSSAAASPYITLTHPCLSRSPTLAHPHTMRLPPRLVPATAYPSLTTQTIIFLQQPLTLTSHILTQATDISVLASTLPLRRPRHSSQVNTEAHVRTTPSARVSVHYPLRRAP